VDCLVLWAYMHIDGMYHVYFPPQIDVLPIAVQYERITLTLPECDLHWSMSPRWDVGTL